MMSITVLRVYLSLERDAGFGKTMKTALLIVRVTGRIGGLGRPMVAKLSHRIKQRNFLVSFRLVNGVRNWLYPGTISELTPVFREHLNEQEHCYFQ